MATDTHNVPTPANPLYNSPTPGRITIAAMYPNQGTTAPSLQVLTELHDCGFNSALINTEGNSLATLLTNCNSKGIHPFVGNPRLTQSAQCEEFVGDNKGLDGLGGWLLKDTVSWPEVKAGSTFHDLVTIIRDTDTPKNNEIIKAVHPIFTGLEPSEDFIGIQDNDDYRQYITDFQTSLNPSFWPYRYFSYVNTPQSPSIRYANFYRGLETFSFMSRYTNVPLWSYIRAVKPSGLAVPVDSRITEAMIRFEAFSALAYGAQGIVYWRYRTESDKTEGLVTAAGAKTGLWNYAQTVNREIASYNFIFAGCRLVACRHTGKNKLPMTCWISGSESFGPLMNIQSEDPGVLISHINNDGKNYLVIVNHSVTASQALTLNFSRYWCIYQLKDLTETPYPSPAIPTETPLTLNVTLPAGGYIIYRWD